MSRGTEKQLIRLLQGELSEPEARDLRRRIERDEDLRTALTSLQQLWEDLEPEPIRAVPRGYAEQVVRRAVSRRSDTGAVRWSSSPRWSKALAAAAMVGGVALGVVLASPAETEEWAMWTTAQPTQAEVYWESLGVETEDELQEDLR